MSTKFIPLAECSAEDHQTLHDGFRGVYLHGYCYELAIALHQGLGWQIIGLMQGDIPQHVCVRCPDGRLFDIRGFITQEEFGEPYLPPPYNLRDVSLADLLAIQPVSDLGIARARKTAEVIWPDLPWLDSFAARAIAFADELALLCHKHQLWVWDSSANSPILSVGDGSEGGYRLQPNLDGSAMIIKLYFD